MRKKEQKANSVQMTKNPKMPLHEMQNIYKILQFYIRFKVRLNSTIKTMRNRATDGITSSEGF